VAVYYTATGRSVIWNATFGKQNWQNDFLNYPVPVYYMRRGIQNWQIDFLNYPVPVYYMRRGMHNWQNDFLNYPVPVYYMRRGIWRIPPWRITALYKPGKGP